VFSTLIGGAGWYVLTPTGRYTWGSYHSPRSLIWNSRWATADGVIESRESFALPADPQVVTVRRRILTLDRTGVINAVLRYAPPSASVSRSSSLSTTSTVGVP
jgi:alpha,alpha-trehalase